MTHLSDAHSYVWSMAGRCVRCQQPEAGHMTMLAEPDPLTECTVDHKSLNASLLIGDTLEWKRCPFCQVMVEGAMRTGELTGPTYGSGRGDLTPRQKKDLIGWRGWVEYNGGS